MIPLCLFLHPVEVPLKGSTTLWDIGHVFQLRVIGELTEEASAPFIQVTDKQYWTNIDPLGTPLDTGLQLELAVELGGRSWLAFYVWFCKHREM